MTFNLRLSRARTGVVAMRQDSSYYNNWIPQNWRQNGVKIIKNLKNFADDTTVVGLIIDNDETAYREKVRDLGLCARQRS